MCPFSTRRDVSHHATEEHGNLGNGKPCDTLSAVDRQRYRTAITSHARQRAQNRSRSSMEPRTTGVALPFDVYSQCVLLLADTYRENNPTAIVGLLTVSRALTGEVERTLYNTVCLWSERSLATFRHLVQSRLWTDRHPRVRSLSVKLDAADTAAREAFVALLYWLRPSLSNLHVSDALHYLAIRHAAVDEIYLENWKFKPWPNEAPCVTTTVRRAVYALAPGFQNAMLDTWPNLESITIVFPDRYHSIDINTPFLTGIAHAVHFIPSVHFIFTGASSSHSRNFLEAAQPVLESTFVYRERTYGGRSPSTRTYATVERDKWDVGPPVSVTGRKRANLWLRTVLWKGVTPLRPRKAVS